MKFKDPRAVPHICCNGASPLPAQQESDVLSAGEVMTLVDLPWCRAGSGISGTVAGVYQVACKQGAPCIRPVVSITSPAQTTFVLLPLLPIQ